MRLKHVKKAEEKINHSTYLIKEPQQYKGNFKSLFQNNNEIHIEIGTGKGLFLLQMAKTYPNINFIGIEKYDSVIVRAIEKIEENPLDNLRFIRMDATNIEEVFDHEINTIYLNFSDPWPKDRHEKRRLTSSVFLKKYDTIFKDKKHIIMKTDNRHLFEYSTISFVKNDYKIDDISLDLHKEQTENIQTEYEIKFSNLGYPIYKIEVSK
jgi:tRNA (guanine-N7-)-methyltransferase